MPNVTVVNGTNWPINILLSAGFNYAWHNHLGPKEVVSVGDSYTVVTLSVRRHFDETSEYEATSAVDIGLFVAGTVVGIAGLALAPLTAGLSLDGVLAAFTVIGSASLIGGGASMAIGGLAFAAKDFENKSRTRPGVELRLERKFIVEGDMAFETNDDGSPKLTNGILTVTGQKELTLRDLTEAEFKEGLEKKGWVHHREDPAEASPVGDMFSSVLPDEIGKSTGMFIYPSYAGVPDLRPARWSILGDDDNEPIGLSRDAAAKNLWTVEQVAGKAYKLYNPKTSKAGSDRTAPVYRLKNVQTGRYACVGRDAADTRLRTTRTPDNYSLFFLINSGPCFAFVPITREELQADAAHLPAIISDRGAIDPPTPVIVGDRTGPNPGWARWVLDPLDWRHAEFITRENLAKVPTKPVRIYPAMARRHQLQKGERPPCWGVMRSNVQGFARSTVDQPFFLADPGMTIKNNEGVVAWELRCEDRTPNAPAKFVIWNREFDVYAVVGRDGVLRSRKRPEGIFRDDEEETFLFAIFRDSMGYVSFVPLRKGNPASGNALVVAPEPVGGETIRTEYVAGILRAPARWVLREFEREEW
jgi:hypothetical protein